MTTDEQASVQRLAHSRTEPARRVERARILWLGRQGQRVPAMATALRLSETTVRQWLQRFHAPGGAGLRDQPRAGRPPTYTTEEGGAVIALSLTNPRRWGLPFASWTLDRRAAYLPEQKGIAIKRTRIDELLLAEGLRWRTPETGFGERVDPAFAEKRGPSSRATPRLRRVG